MLENAIRRQPRLTRFLIHLFQRLTQQRLNLVFGAGISVDANVPGWHDLLTRLSETPPELQADLSLHKADGLNPEYLGQILYHRHKSGCTVDIPAEYGEASGAPYREAIIQHKWAEAIHVALYAKVHREISDVINDHPYFSALIELVRKVPLVINFNFDDLLTEAIGYQVEKK